MPNYDIEFGTALSSLTIPTRYDLPKWKQVHGDRSVEVKSSLDVCGETDGLYTFAPRVPIAVVTADCVPVLLASNKRPFAAAIHAGWRGTRAQIVKKLILKITAEFQIEANELRAWIGPCIGACCYEVSQEMIDDFRTHFDFLDGSAFNPSPRRLDLAELHDQELKSLGIQSIQRVNECTRCMTLPQSNEFKYASYRREKNGARQYSLIQIQRS